MAEGDPEIPVLSLFYLGLSTRSSSTASCSCRLLPTRRLPALELNPPWWPGAAPYGPRVEVEMIFEVP